MTDNSEDWSIYDSVANAPFDAEESRAIAERFGIEDNTTFEGLLRTWSAIYRNNVRAYQSVPTWKQRRRIYSELSTSMRRTVGALDKLGSATSAPLRRIEKTDFDELPSALQNAALLKVDTVSEAGEPTAYDFDLELAIVAAKILENRALELHTHYSGPPPSGHNKSILREMPLRVLIANLEQYWLENIGEAFTRRFSEDNEIGETECEPINECSKFVVRCANVIDPGLKNSMIKKGMATHIKEVRIKKNQN